MKKMIMAVVPRDEAEAVLKALIEAGYKATFSESRGGKLRQAQQTLFIAVAQEELELVLSIIRSNCGRRRVLEPRPSGVAPFSYVPASSDVSGTVIFVWDLDRFENY